MDVDPVSTKAEDTICPSKNLPFDLQPVEFVAVNIKNEPESEEEENAFEFVHEDVGEREIKVEKLDAASEDLVSPSLSLCTDRSHHPDAVITKEEDSAACFENGEGSTRLDSLPLQNVEFSHFLDTVNSKRELTQRVIGPSKKKPTTGGQKSTHLGTPAETSYPCPECPATFKERCYLRRHSKIHSRKHPHACDYCSASFSNAQTLALHTSLHGVSKKFPCPHCRATFQNEAMLRDHSPVHSKERPFTCAHCAATFKSKSAIYCHIVGSQNPFMAARGPTTHCKVLFSSVAQKRPLKTPSNVKPLSCTQCAAMFVNVGFFNQHLMAHSYQKVQEKSEQFSQLDTNSSALFDTDKPHDPEARLTVKTNEADEIGENSFQAAVSSSVGAETLTEQEAPVDTFKCMDCGLTFDTRPRLKHHMELRHGSPFLCLYCCAAFSSVVAFKRHLDGHTNDRVFACGGCTATFRDKEQLLQHVAEHRVEKHFSCEYCSAVFLSSKEYEAHLRIHSAGKLLCCGRCPSTSKDKAALKKHMLTHSREMFYPCAHCGVTFKSNAHLERHAAIHLVPSAKKSLSHPSAPCPDPLDT